MESTRSDNVKGKVLVMGALCLLLTASPFFFLHHKERSEAFRQLAARQSLLTDLVAAGLEEPLQRLEDGMGHLAEKGEDLRQNPGETGEGLAMLFHSVRPRVLDSLFFLDDRGNILAAYPPGRKRAVSPPGRILSGFSPSVFSPRLISLEGKPVLLLSHPLQGAPPQGELAALISTENLVRTSLPPGQGWAGSCFLLDEKGHFLFHPDRSLVGRAFSETVSADAPPGLSRLFTAMTHGEQGTLRALIPSAAGSAEPDRAEEKTLLAFRQMQVPGARWSLALGLPAGEMAAMEESHGRFLFGLCLGLLLAVLLFIPAARRWQQARLLREEMERLRGEIPRLQKALDLSERRYRHFLDNAGDAIFFIDPSQGTLQGANRRAEELLGYTADEIRSLSLAVLFPGRQRRRYLHLLKRVRNAGYAEEGSLVFRRKNGQLFTGAVHARLGDLGEEKVVHGVLRDVTELKRIEQELRLKNRNLILLNEIAHRAAWSRNLGEMLYDVLARVIQTFDAGGGGIYLTQPDESVLRLAAHQGFGEDVFQDIALSQRGRGLAGRVAASGLPRSSADLQLDRRVRSPAVKADGWKGFQAVPLAANEKTVGVLFIFYRSRRILGREEVNLLLAIGKQIGTAVEGAQSFEALQWQHRLIQAGNRELEHSRRQLRENLVRMEEANRALERLDRMKSNFLALASHELRTPLTYVLSGAELLGATMAKSLSAEEKRMLEAVHQGGKRLEGIVQDLLEAAQIESRSIYLAREPVDLPGIMAEIGREFQLVLEKRSLAFQISGFPAPLEIHGDPHHLKRTFKRLLENAVKFTPEGGRIEILADLKAVGEVRQQEALLRPFSLTFFDSLTDLTFLQITIRDSGVGIDPEEQVRVFDKFYEIGDITGHFTSQTRFGGKRVGLGLTLVKGMVEAHGGMVWVESRGTGENAAGSAFHVLLPLAAEAGLAGRIGADPGAGLTGDDFSPTNG